MNIIFTECKQAFPIALRGSLCVLALLLSLLYRHFMYFLEKEMLLHYWDGIRQLTSLKFRSQVIITKLVTISKLKNKFQPVAEILANPGKHVCKSSLIHHLALLLPLTSQ